jgi:hypothetical protein
MMADLAIPKKSHPMQEHLDQIKKSSDALDRHFRDQMEMQIQYEAAEKQKSKTQSPAAKDLGFEE